MSNLIFIINIQKVAVEIYEIVIKDEFYGKPNEDLIRKLKKKLNAIFPLATLFKDDDKQHEEEHQCLQSLSTIRFTGADLSEKINSLNIK